MSAIFPAVNHTVPGGWQCLQLTFCSVAARAETRDRLRLKMWVNGLSTFWLYRMYFVKTSEVEIL